MWRADPDTHADAHGDTDGDANAVAHAHQNLLASPVGQLSGMTRGSMAGVAK